MRIDILTLFPGMFQGPLTESILGRAQMQGHLTVHLHGLRQWGKGKYKQVDDRPYGGGAGMVMRADVVVPAIESITGGSEGELRCVTLSPSKGDTTKRAMVRRARLSGRQAHHDTQPPHRIYLSPRGKRLTQAKVERLAKKPWVLLLCGHYEGVDQRVVDGGWIDEELSIGDYVLTGGELPAMVLIDAVARQLPGVLGKDESKEEESFSGALGRRREYPHYTRPEEFRGVRVPEVLLGGHHAEVKRWRQGKVW